MTATKEYFLLLVFLNIIFTCVIGAPQNGEEDGELTTEGIHVYRPVSPPKSLCDDSEDTVACSIYDFLRSIFKVGRSVGTLVSVAQRVVGSEGNGTEYLLGDGIQDNVNYYEKTYLNELLPPQINNLKDCQDGWDYFPHTNKCYKPFNYSTIITWMDAQHTCRQFGGNLPIISDDETNLYVSNLVGGAHNWIGAYRVGPSNENDQFAWIDGSPIVYAPWTVGNPSNSIGNELCVHMSGWEKDNAGWNDYDFWSENSRPLKVMDFVCQSDVRSKFKQIGGECPDGWTYFDQTNRCYALFNEPSITWMDAQYNCTTFGGDLAMIFDEQTNDFVSTVRGGSIAWIGAHRVGPYTYPIPRNDQFTWIDGSALEFSNWSGGQPDNYNGGEFCVEVNRFGPTTWNDQPCDSKNDNYICQI